jgi:hypothetical protein
MKIYEYESMNSIEISIPFKGYLFQSNSSIHTHKSSWKLRTHSDFFYLQTIKEQIRYY